MRIQIGSWELEVEPTFGLFALGILGSVVVAIVTTVWGKA